MYRGKAGGRRGAVSACKSFDLLTASSAAGFTALPMLDGSPAGRKLVGGKNTVRSTEAKKQLPRGIAELGRMLLNLNKKFN